MNRVRLAEWQSRHLDWPREARLALAQAATGWQSAHNLPRPPLEWGGIDGKTLRACQYVGVLEIEGYRVEIYPKLDAALLGGALPDGPVAASTLRALLPMLEAAHFGSWIEVGNADLGAAALSFVDVWAFLLGKHLSPELRRGLPRAYQHERDDLPSVRGQIAFARQIGRNFNRLDQIACEWNEFTPDTPLNRLFKCAARTVLRRTSHPGARGLLGDCVFALDEAGDVAPPVALRETERLVWSRSQMRFEPTFRLARRLLEELSPDLEGQSGQSWSFLLDMNQVFEGFCAAVLEAKFATAVETQKLLPTLLRNPNAMKQLADFVWTHQTATPQTRWIGDAKWKLLEEKRVAIEDVRQLTVYAELLCAHESLGQTPHLAILFPTLGESGTPKRLRTWNGTTLHLWPVRVQGAASLAEAISV